MMQHPSMTLHVLAPCDVQRANLAEPGSIPLLIGEATLLSAQPYLPYHPNCHIGCRSLLNNSLSGSPPLATYSLSNILSQSIFCHCMSGWSTLVSLTCLPVQRLTPTCLPVQRLTPKSWSLLGEQIVFTVIASSPAPNENPRQTNNTCLHQHQSMMVGCQPYSRDACLAESTFCPFHKYPNSADIASFLTSSG
jgi:hypothetical protein